MIKNVFSQIDKLRDEYIAVWEDVCNLESPSGDKEAVDRVGQYFQKLAQKHRWQIEVMEQERFGDVVCVTMNPESANKPIAISGHMDTVHPIGSFGTPAVRIDENNLYGPGAVDCKGGIVAGFLAMEALHRCGFKGRPVMMLLQSNEEVGSGMQNKGPIQCICNKAKDAVAFLNLEGHDATFTGKTCMIRKGITVFRFDIEGVATHSSRCAREGANAIAEAAHKIIEIEKIKDDGGLTCSCNVISGGSVSNTVPALCSFKLDVRFYTEEEYKRALEYLQKVADTVYVPGCTCKMTQTNLRQAMELKERNIALLSKVNALFEESGLTTLEMGKRAGASDAADVTAFGIPCLDSLGVAGERIHSVEEYGVLDSLTESAKRIAAIACGI